MKIPLSVFCLVSVFFSACENHRHYAKRREEANAIIYNAIIPPTRDQMRFVRSSQRLFESARLRQNIESICYLDGRTLQVTYLDNEQHQIRYNLSYLEPQEIQVYFNLDPAEKGWLISYVVEYDGHSIWDESKLFKNKIGAVIHLPINVRLESCK